MELAPWLAIWPGLSLTIVVYSLNMLGDALRDLLDPRLTRKRAVSVVWVPIIAPSRSSCARTAFAEHDSVRGARPARRRTWHTSTAPEWQTGDRAGGRTSCSTARAARRRRDSRMGGYVARYRNGPARAVDQSTGRERWRRPNSATVPSVAEFLTPGNPSIVRPTTPTWLRPRPRGRGSRRRYRTAPANRRRRPDAPRRCRCPRSLLREPTDVALRAPGRGWLQDR